MEAALIARRRDGDGLAHEDPQARPSKQPLMVRTFLKVYMELGSYFLFLQEQLKDIIIIGEESSPGSQNPVESRGALLACAFRGGVRAGRFLPVAENALGHASMLCVLNRAVFALLPATVPVSLNSSGGSHVVHSWQHSGLCSW
jgi:hypothetical protein